ncbi:hypothetical protein [Ectobacillus panaciterrae]|uniref:hypothetical protein n=1 Tax=Ectobacillus panaciterrae TaxID=363872 RepID=UPI000418F077|nr:hypothetical protein [Ectobacillus panaciterrae]
MNCAQAAVYVCNKTEGSGWSSADCYQAGDTAGIKLDICNNGNEEMVQISVSHMIRDYLLVMPNTLKAEQGDASLLFQLVRWRIASLKPGESAALFFEAKIRDVAHSPISLTASYTFQTFHKLHGPYQAQGAALEKREP